MDISVEPGYEVLAEVLKGALDRAQYGKGKQRHATGEPFASQPIIEIPKALGGGPSPLLFQAVKKIYESRRLQSTPEAEVNELLDAVVYIAAAIILRRES